MRCGESKSAGRTAESLYVKCVDFCVPRMEESARGGISSESWQAVERLGGSVAEDLLRRAFQLANTQKTPAAIKKKWKDEWRVFYTSKISSAILSWDEDLIIHVKNRCKNLKQIEVIHLKEFRPGLVLQCPATLVTLDFDGELVNRGKAETFLELREEPPGSWLCDSEKILRSLLVWNAKIPEHPPGSGMRLAELHLGNIPAKPEDLIGILRHCSNLRLLKHYQLVSALYKLHCDSWRKKEKLPTYQLRNLDVDFSHVVRCRMSPEWVLAPDALQLAVKLCPRAVMVRVRFDCSTPNDVLTPLLELEAIREFSAVCVSSGERSLVDFSDMSAILEKFGPVSLSYLELKVIEEVEIHEVIQNCPRLTTLILSGCGYVTPTTCSSYNCRAYPPGSLKKLRLLFYADGDDFSWDHGVPECFWKSTLLPSGINQVLRLQGLFLEYPRMSRGLTSAVFSPGGAPRLPFPSLVALSFCRFEEITIEDIASVCGLSGKVDPCHSLKYLMLSDCEKIGLPEKRALTQRLKQARLEDVKVHVDR